MSKPIVRWKHPFGHEMRGILVEVQEKRAGSGTEEIAIVEVLDDLLPSSVPIREDGQTWAGKYHIPMSELEIMLKGT